MSAKRIAFTISVLVLLLGAATHCGRLRDIDDCHGRDGGWKVKSRTCDGAVDP